MEKINIFVISHKLVDPSKYPGRKIIYVGNKHNSQADNNTTFVDNVGDNISHLNPYYCELTALYWVWKNYPKSEYIGFEHYSRNFTRNMVNLAKLDYLYKKAKTCDFITIFAPKHIKSNLDMFLDKEGKYLYRFLKDGVKTVSPTYYDDFMKVMNRHQLSYCNMFICRWEVFEKYMTFIFNILNKCYSNLQVLPESQKSRSIGFISERLLDTYILHNNLKNKSCWIKTKKH